MSTQTEEEEIFARLPLTIGELRRLNRETVLSWPLSMLTAITECGICLERRRDAEIRPHFLTTDDEMRLTYAIVSEGKAVGLIEPVDFPTPGYRAVRKLKVSDFEQR